MLYFDHCATTPPHAEVIDAIYKVSKDYYGNPSSIHRLGLEAEKLVHKARDVISSSLRVKPGTIIFTSGGTESNNLAIKGVALQYRQRGNHLITTLIEHASVYESFKQLEAMGFRVTYLPVDERGAVSVEDVQKAIGPDTILVSVMHVNNETGSIQPIQEIGQLLRQRPRIVFHVDAVQSIGKLPMDPSAYGIDLMSVSAHKIRGPKGTGILYKKDGIQLQPLFSGGGQEFGLRSGTENVPLIVAMAKAVRMAVESRKNNTAYLYKLRERLIRCIGLMPQLILNGSSNEQMMAPHIVNFSYPGMKSEVVVHALEKHDIFVSTKSACSSGAERPSRVLAAMGVGEKRAQSGVRISLSADHSKEDVDFLCEKLQSCVEELKRTVRSER
jgi:cysteine desulfurase